MVVESLVQLDHHPRLPVVPALIAVHINDQTYLSQESEAI